MDTLLQIDWQILNDIQTLFRCSILDGFMRYFTLIGEAGIIWIIAGFYLIFTKKYRKDGILVIIVLLLGLLITNITLKNVVQRPRPCWIVDNIDILIKMPTDYSFPSGHAQSGFAAATVICRADKKFVLPSLLLAALLSFSRLYLYVHFPSDVFLGAIIGFAIAFFAISVDNKYKLIDRLLTKLNLNKEN